MCRAMKRDIVAVVNRSDLGDEEVVRYLEREGIPVLGQIPFDRAIATAYANGALAAARSTRLRATLEAIATHIGVGTSDRRSP